MCAPGCVIFPMSGAALPECSVAVWLCLHTHTHTRLDYVNLYVWLCLRNPGRVHVCVPECGCIPGSLVVGKSSVFQLYLRGHPLRPVGPMGIFSSP